MLIAVFGTGVGIATKRPSTKNRATPMPMATTWVTGEGERVMGGPSQRGSVHRHEGHVPRGAGAEGEGAGVVAAGDRDRHPVQRVHVQQRLAHLDGGDAVRM